MKELFLHPCMHYLKKQSIYYVHFHYIYIYIYIVVYICIWIGPFPFISVWTGPQVPKCPNELENKNKPRRFWQTREQCVFSDSRTYITRYVLVLVEPNSTSMYNCTLFWKKSVSFTSIQRITTCVMKTTTTTLSKFQDIWMTTSAQSTKRTKKHFRWRSHDEYIYQSTYHIIPRLFCCLYMAWYGTWRVIYCTYILVPFFLYLVHAVCRVCNCIQYVCT